MSEGSPATAAAFLPAHGATLAVQPSPPQAAPPPQGPPPPDLLRRVVVRALIVGLAVLAGGLFMVDWDDLLLLSAVQRTDDAYLQGDPTTLSTRVPGYVRRVAVGDMATVQGGQVLYEIDDAEYRARVDLARAQVADAAAQVAIATARLALQERQIDVTQSNADLAQSDLIQAVQEAGRQEALRGTPAYLHRAWEQATQNALALQATVAGNRAEIASQTAQLRVLRATLQQSKAGLQAKQSALQNAQISLGYTRVLAPRDGRLGFRIVRVGQYVAAGAPLIELVPRNDIWVVANFRETQVRNMRVGQPARLTLDAYPGITLAGHVDSIEPGSQALASLLPPDRAVGNFTKIAQRVPVKIRIDPGQARQNELIGRLFPGLSVEAAVDTAATSQSAPASRP